MKKQLTFLASIMACTFAAADNLAQQSTNTHSPPMLKLAVYHTTNKAMKQIEGLKYSVSQKGQNLCWTVFNMPFSSKNTVIEIFESPKKAHFVDPNSAVVSSKNGIKHTITSSLPSQNNEYIQRCWTFDKKDPKGQYRLTIQVNNIAFGTQTFEVVK